MSFKNAFITILTFLIAIQFLPSNNAHSTGRVNSAPVPVITPPVAEALVEEPSKEYYFKPPNGSSWSYQAGQCVWGVSVWTGVPAGLGNGSDWDDRARSMGYTVTQTPSVGSIAQKNGGYGHVGQVIDKTDTMVLTREMNVRGPYSTITQWQPYSYWDNYIIF